MKRERGNKWNSIFWVLWVIFLTLSILNFIFIHAIPGLFYFVVSFAYLPPFGRFLHKKTGWKLPPLIWLIIALLLLWATLAVGDLMELLEAQLLRN